MGSYASLDIGDIQLGWAKNDAGSYGWLFSKGDRKRVKVKNEDGSVNYEIVYKAKLGSLIRRLELSGYKLLEESPRFVDWLGRPLPAKKCAYIFDSLKKLDVRLVKRVGWNVGGGFEVEYQFPIERLNDVCEKDHTNFLSSMTAGDILRTLYENPSNHSVDVVWNFSHVINGGWVTHKEVAAGVGNEFDYLIITEGSSDSFVIQKAVRFFFPEVAEGFRFVDMKENYPFTGTGSLLNFCKGLAKVGYSRRAIILFDNDTEGRRSYEAAKKLVLPSNMTVARLPNLDIALSFPTIGPSGESVEDINGRAVSIELFLDFRYKMTATPRVRWLAYDHKMESYQGALDGKDEVLRKFKSVRLGAGSYDTSRLNTLVSFIYEMCIND